MSFLQRDLNCSPHHTNYAVKRVSPPSLSACEVLLHWVTSHGCNGQGADSATRERLIADQCMTTWPRQLFLEARQVSQKRVATSLVNQLHNTRFPLQPVITDMRRLTTGIRSEKCVVRRFRRCANIIVYTIIVPTKCTSLLKAQYITILYFFVFVFLAPTCFVPRGTSSGGAMPVPN
jgi:hypothetical protein